MANHDPLTGYPYGAKAPFPHGSANEASERIVKSPNFDEGSSHAPTGDIALSGSMGHGLAFADAFPFAGDLDVTDGVTFDAPSSGSIIFGKLVAVDVRGPLSFKAGTAGAPGSAQWESGASATFLSGSSFTLASGATMALTGNTTVRGSLTIKASGGPGSLIIEAGTTNPIAGLAQFLSTSEQRFTAGSKLTGTIEVSGTTTITLKDSIEIGLDPVRAWTRRLSRVAAATRGPGVVTPSDPPIALADVFSPLFAAPALFMDYTAGAASSTTEKAIFELETPPDGTTIAQVVIKSLGESSLDAITQVPTYRIVRWQDGLLAAPENMSNVTNDDHDGTAADWVTVHTTTVTINAHATIDRAYRYGVLVTHALKAGNVPMAFWLNGVATGTAAKITGK